MRKLITITSICLFTCMGTTALAQNEPTKQEKPKQEYRMENDEKKVEISAMELPEEARRDIVDNYHNGEILKAYKITRDGEMNGYLAEVKKGPKVWYIRFDKDGNAENKVNP